MRFATCSLLALAFLHAGAALGEPPAWDLERYDPQPLDDDLRLPMPCGGGMAFRRVNVPGGGPLDDEPIRLGSHRTEHGPTEYRRKTWLAGAFGGGEGEPEEGGSGPGGAGAARHYFIGKYEVTAMQYAVFTGVCPDPDDPGLEVPATGVSWAEASLFAERYSEWLAANAADRLPFREGAAGFLRLPTEAEWEFAARGGTKVGPSEFAADTFAPPGELDEYVVHDGNSYRELGVIGTLKPNPLGVHDVLGNAAELVLDPFRLDAVGRLHGQAGGFVLRGGSYRTRPSDVRTSHRIEHPPVDAHGLRRAKTAGFRLVLVAPALPSRRSHRRVREAWEARQRQSGAPAEERARPRLGEEQADPVEEARALADAAPGPEMKRRLRNLAAVIAENVRTRKEERERAAQESLSNAVFAARRIVAGDLPVLGRWSRLMELTAKDPERQDQIRKRYDADRETYEFNLRYYLDQLTTIGGDYGGVDLPRQAEMLKGKYADRGLALLPPITDLVLDHLRWTRASGPAAKERIERSLEDMARADGD